MPGWLNLTNELYKKHISVGWIDQEGWIKLDCRFTPTFLTIPKPSTSGPGSTNLDHLFPAVHFIYIIYFLQYTLFTSFISCSTLCLHRLFPAVHFVYFTQR